MPSSGRAVLPLSAALEFTIYADLERAVRDARRAASRGYAGIVANARGKRLSVEAIAPYEHEVADTVAVIDWITRQPWSDGDVGMYGGSYNGYTAWAAAKRMPPALKTIVAYVAAIPGFGLPMENNVFLNANYGWAFYVTNNRYLDEFTYNQTARWRNLNRAWYQSGRPYREIDRVDGTPNPWLQRWLRHPAFDAYWQAKVPYGEEFARIAIPVLTITGYYDDGQLSALRYLREHYRHRPGAEHYLLIGPYDHFGAQAPVKPTVLRDYRVDPVAQFDTNAVTFDWLDYVMRDGPRPALLKDRINYQVMGTNAWKHAPSLEAMSGRTWRLFLTADPMEQYLRLSEAPPRQRTFLQQTVDLADRTTPPTTVTIPRRSSGSSSARPADWHS
jgi:putative CocE/NonD family hydrolase